MNAELVALGEKINDALVDFCIETKRFPSNLSGLCAVGSYLLVAEAKKKLNLNVKFVGVYGHCWTTYHGRIYDVTATQFGRKEKVYAPSLKEVSLDRESVMAHYYYKIADDKASLLSIDHINDHWPSWQTPNNFNITWINQSKARITDKDDG